MGGGIRRMNNIIEGLYDSYIEMTDLIFHRLV